MTRSAALLLLSAITLAACSNPRREDGNEAEIAADAQRLDNQAQADASLIVNEIEVLANDAQARAAEEEADAPAPSNASSNE